MSQEEGAHRPAAELLPAVARRALELRQLVVKGDGALWIADVSGDVRPAATLTATPDLSPDTLSAARLGECGRGGLYHAGACFLSCCALTIEGDSLPPPSAAEVASYEAMLAFPELSVRQRDLSVFRSFLADGATLHQWITIESQAAPPTPVAVTITLGACAGASWQPRRPTLDGAALRFRVDGTDGATRTTTVTFDRAPYAARWLDTPDGGPDTPLVAVSFHLRPALAEPATLALTIVPESEAPSPKPARRGGASNGRARASGYRNAAAVVRERHACRRLSGAIYRAHHPVVDAVLARSAADLDLLRQPVGAEGRRVPVAGLPTRGAIYARDALLAAFQTVALDSQLAIETLHTLAREQGTGGQGTARGAECGQIGVVAASGCLDAGADAGKLPLAGLETTSLWLALLAETLDWTGDLSLFDELLPAAWRALRWIDRAMSRSGYLNAGPGDTYPVFAPEPITPLRAQAYTYLARRLLARVLRRRGAEHERGEAAMLEEAADDLRHRIERDFWLAGEGCYAAALDADGRAMGGVTSASAHALWARMPSAPRAARLATRLVMPDLDSGWGLRTRACGEDAFDPLSATGGAVWPHETALAAAGLASMGHSEASARLARGVFMAAAAHLDDRLPEYFGGDTRSGVYADAPRTCPDACAPAACAAASPFGVVSGMLGLEADALGHQLVVRPVLPVWLRRISIQHLRLGDAWIDLEVHRIGREGVCEVNARVTAGDAHVLVLPPVRAHQ